MHWFSFILGLLIGWLAEWLIDFFYWRRRYRECAETRARQHEELASVRADLWQAHAASAQAEKLQIDLAAAKARIAELEGELAGLRARVEPPAAVELSAGVTDAPASNKVEPLPAENERLSAIAPSAAAAAEDNLELIEGIGPAIARLLRENNIHTFAALADASPAALRTILDVAGPRFRMAAPETWPQQAALAAQGEWGALKELQGRLRAGRA